MKTPHPDAVKNEVEHLRDTFWGKTPNGTLICPTMTEDGWKADLTSPWFAKWLDTAAGEQAITVWYDWRINTLKPRYWSEGRDILESYQHSFSTVEALKEWLAEIQKRVDESYARKLYLSALGEGYSLKPTHISQVRPGDIILHEGILKTLGKNNIKSGFMGITLWGDCYRLGNKAVLVATPVVKHNR